MPSLTERYASQIAGVLSCWDRIVITGMLPDIGYAQAMAAFLRARGIRLFDFPRWAEPLREEIRENAERLAAENGLTIEFIRKKDFRKEERVKEILARRGRHPGLVHIFSALESCPSYKPWYDKTTGKTGFRGTEAKCLHYYFYFVDEEFGLCYLRVPTWAPFRLQFYCNGHQYLAAQLSRRGLGYTLVDNAFLEIEDFAKAQKLADDFRVSRLHRRLKRWAALYCPVLRHFAAGYHFSLMQIEYATDLIFKREADLTPLYEAWSRTAIHTVKPEQVATFLGRKLHPLYQGEVGNDFNTRKEGTRIKHRMGSASIKMYNKLGRVLRIETTANDVTFFKHHRRVEHADGSWEMKVAPAKKSIYSLPDLRVLLGDANRRYLAFLSVLDDPTAAIRELDRIGQPTRDGQRSYRGFNLFSAEDLRLFEALSRGEFNLSGFMNRHLQTLLPKHTSHQISRLLARLHQHGLIKKIGNTYKYYLTCLGKKAILTALKLQRLFVIPSMQEAFGVV